MAGVLKVLFWTVLAALVAIGVAVGLGIFQLSRLFPGADEGAELVEQIENEVRAAHPGFTVSARAEQSFGEVSAEISPTDGELTDDQVQGVLTTMDGIATEHADSRWRIESHLSGTLDGIPLEIEDTLVDRWPTLSAVLGTDLGPESRVLIYLGANRAVVEQRSQSEEFCGEDGSAQAYFDQSVSDAGRLITDLDWDGPEDPGLLYLGRACQDGELRSSLDLSGEDRSGRVADLTAVLAAVPADNPPVGVTIEPEGKLLLALQSSPDEQTAQSLAEPWTQGEVWLNGELASTG